MSLSWRGVWVRAVKYDFPANKRVVRSTLLVIGDLMRADGTLTVNRDRIVDAVGFPRRTVDRHIADAIALGWLVCTRKAAPGVVPRYEARIPLRNVSSTDATSGASRMPESTDERMPPDGMFKERPPSASEDGAFDGTRQRRTDHNGTRRGTARYREATARSSERRVGATSSSSRPLGAQRPATFKRHDTTAGRSRPGHSLGREAFA